MEVQVQVYWAQLSEKYFSFSARDDELGQPDPVQMQYTDYPYPPFSEGELDREELYYQVYDAPLVHSEVVALESLNHFLYGGKEDFKNGFRVLFAGIHTALFY